MSAPAVTRAGKPSVSIRGTPYPLLLPRLSDPRLHLAVVIVSLQVLGQVEFEFDLSIAQILVALLTCALLEVGIAFRRQRVILWPASALLTGNGVAFILRVPGTEHGDWWSMRGWWVFAGTAAVALLSKYVIRFRGRHVFNPSNFGLVPCFLLLGPGRADPLAFWWGPMSPWMVLALAIIVTGGLAILSRLGLLSIAFGFWLAFAAALGVLAASGHEMTARWHLGPITGFELWRVLVFSPEILVFLFFMITDPKTIPEGRTARRVYTVGVALVSVLLIAPFTTEFAAKVAVLAGLALVCAARPVLLMLASTASGRLVPHTRVGAAALALTATAGFAGILVLAGIPARPAAVAASPVTSPHELPRVTVGPSQGVASTLDRPTALGIAQDLVADLRSEADALRLRNEQRASEGAAGLYLQELWTRIRAARGGSIVVPIHRIDGVVLTLEAQVGQGPPLVVSAVSGTRELVTYAGTPPTVERRERAEPFQSTLELTLTGSRYLITRIRTGTVDAAAVAAPSTARAGVAALGDVTLTDVAAQVGLDFRQGAFRFQVDIADQPAMMGGGVCWLDYDRDGWMDLFVVNSYSELDFLRWEQQGGLPRSALFHNERGRFVDVSRRSGADLPLRGSGCVAADFDLDGHTDLYVTTGGYNVATDGYDALLWNDGDGTFTEGARAAGINAPGWHAGAAVGDVDGDGRPDLFVAGYTERSAPIPGSVAGFPNNYQGVRDLLYVNAGPGKDGRTRFREVGVQAGLENARLEHGLGALLTDVNGDGRLDLYVANDANPNRLYVNAPFPGGESADPARLGFRFVERGRAAGVADPSAGMGIAAADYTGDGRSELFVTNSHKQLHAVYRSRLRPTGERLFVDARSDFAAAFDTRFAGWGASFADLDLDADLDLVLANGAIPVRHPARDAEPIQVFANLAGRGRSGRFADASALAGTQKLPRLIGRGLAVADYDNDGHLDVAVNSIGDRLVLLRSAGGTGHWLEVDLGRFAPGAVVTAVLSDGRRLVREVHAGSSYLSSEDPRVHFGLGDAEEVRELLIRYPGGRKTRLTNIPADRILSIKA